MFDVVLVVSLNISPDAYNIIGYGNSSTTALLAVIVSPYGGMNPLIPELYAKIITFYFRLKPICELGDSTWKTIQFL